MNPAPKDDNTIYLVLGGFLLLCCCCFIIAGVLGAITYSYSGASGSGTTTTTTINTNTNTSSNPLSNLLGTITGKTVIPKLSVINDCGYTTQTRGWYDIQNQGARNDYCRTVGGGSQPAWFSCALAGATNQYTPISQVIDPNSPHDPPASNLPCPP